MGGWNRKGPQVPEPLSRSPRAPVAEAEPSVRAPRPGSGVHLPGAYDFSVANVPSQATRGVLFRIAAKLRMRGCPRVLQGPNNDLGDPPRGMWLILNPCGRLCFPVTLVGKHREWRGQAPCKPPCVSIGSGGFLSVSSTWKAVQQADEFVRMGSCHHSEECRAHVSKPEAATTAGPVDIDLHRLRSCLTTLIFGLKDLNLCATLEGVL